MARDRSEAAKKAAATRAAKRQADEYAKHNIRRLNENGDEEVVSTAGHPELARHPADPLPEAVMLQVQREGTTPFRDGEGGQVVLRYAGPGAISNARLVLQVTDREAYDRLVSQYAPWWDVLLTARHDRG